LQRLAGAKALLNEGYRKQSVGEWIDTGDFELDNIYSGWKCSLCGHIFCGNKTNFCSNCGAKMKGE
jgi:rubrerythrin